MTSHNDIIIIIATCPNEDEALSIARKLVEAQFAACVQLNPIRSIYRWQGSIDDESEVRLLIKTTGQRFADVEKLIKSESTYQCPEILSYKVAQGATDYIDWIIAET